MSTHEPGDTSSDMISLATLPYDLLLNIARHLDLHDIYALQLVSLSSHVGHRATVSTPGSFPESRPNRVALVGPPAQGAIVLAIRVSCSLPKLGLSPMVGVMAVADYGFRGVPSIHCTTAKWAQTNQARVRAFILIPSCGGHALAHAKFASHPCRVVI